MGIEWFFDVFRVSGSGEWIVFEGCWGSHSNGTTWRAEGSVFFGGISMHARSLLYNRTSHLCWWRIYCEWSHCVNMNENHFVRDLDNGWSIVFACYYHMHVFNSLTLVVFGSREIQKKSVFFQLCSIWCFIDANMMSWKISWFP